MTIDDEISLYLYDLHDAKRAGDVLDPIGAFLLATPIYKETMHNFMKYRAMHVTQRDLLVLVHRLVTERWARRP